MLICENESRRNDTLSMRSTIPFAGVSWTKKKQEERRESVAPASSLFLCLWVKCDRLPPGPTVVSFLHDGLGLFLKCEPQ